MLIYQCVYCKEQKDEGDATAEFIGRGWLHEECRIRMVVGSAAHQLGECSCHGGTRDDPPGVSTREAAKLAYETFQVLQRTKNPVRETNS